MTKQKKALTVKNIHGTFTAPSEDHVQHVLESTGPGDARAQIIREYILGAYDGTEWAGNVDHFARYSERTLAIMACDLDVSRIDDGLAYTKRRAAEIAAKEEAELRDVANRNRNGIKADPAAVNVRFEIVRKCAGRCGADITYEVIAEFAHHAPEVSVKGAHRSFAGGHLCNDCDMRVSDALRGEER